MTTAPSRAAREARRRRLDMVKRLYDRTVCIPANCGAQRAGLRLTAQDGCQSSRADGALMVYTEPAHCALGDATPALRIRRAAMVG